MNAGQALSHNPQSIQFEEFLFTLNGLNKPIIPSKASYGQRYLHQKFLKIIEKLQEQQLLSTRILKYVRNNNTSLYLLIGYMDYREKVLTIQYPLQKISHIKRKPTISILNFLKDNQKLVVILFCV